MPITLTGRYSLAGRATFDSERPDPSFRDNSLLIDASNVANANNNTFVNTPPTGAGPYSGYFDGNGDYLTVADNPSFSFGTGDFTVECWFYIAGNSSVDGNGNRTFTLVGTYPASGTINGYTLGILGNASTTGTGIAFENFVSSVSYTVTYTSTIQQSTWHHVAVVRSGTTTSIYFNGSNVASGTLGNQNVNTSGNTLKIGRNGYSGYLQELNGYISNLRVVKGTALYTSNFVPPANTLTTSYDNINRASSLLLTGSGTNGSTAIADSSPNYFPVTVNGNAQISTAQAPTGMTSSMLFDGNGDYLDVADNAAWQFGTGDFSIEGYVYLNVLPTNAVGFQEAVITSYYHSSLNMWYLMIRNYSGLGLELGGATGTIVANYTFVASRWYHIAATRSSGTARLFIDGQLVASGTFNENVGSLGVPLRVGVASTSIGYFNGHISNLRILKGYALYTSSFKTPAAPLLPTISTQPTTPISSSLMLYGSGTNGSTTFVDSSPNVFTVTRGGDTVISTTQAPTGMSSSMYFDGTGDYLSVPDSDLWNYGTGDFTIEVWVNLASDGRFYTQFVDGLNQIWIRRSSGVIQFQVNSGSVLINLVTTATVSLNVWTHVAVVRNGNVFTIYLNGVSSASTTAAITLPNLASQLWISSYNGVNEHITGYLSNYRIIKGYALYTSNFSVPVAPLQAVIPRPILLNSSLLLRGEGSNNSTSIIDSSPYALAVTRNGDTKISSVQAPTGTSSSIYFDGTGDYLTVPSDTAFDFGTGDFTVEAWVYFNSLGGANYAPIFSNAYLFYVGSSGQMLLWNGSSNDAIGPNNAVSLSQWTHLAWTRNSNTVRMFVNGVQTGSNATVSASIGSGSPNQIGRYSTVDFSGYISNFRIIKGTALYTASFTPPNAPLSPTINREVGLLTCQSSTFVDNSSNRFPITASGNAVVANTNSVPAITRNGNTTQGSFSPFGDNWSAYFDGNGDYLSCSSALFDFTSTYTWEAWIYQTSRNSVDGNGLFFTSSGGITSDSNRIQIGMQGDGTFYYYAQNAVGQNTTIIGTIAVPLNTWTHVAVVRNVNTITIFVNGIAAGSASTSINPISNDIYIGFLRSSGVLQYFPGYISNLRIVKGTALYTANFTPPTRTLSATAEYQAPSSLLLLGSGTNGSTSFTDSSPNAFTVTRFGDTVISTLQAPPGMSSSMYFDGTGDYLSVPNNAVFDFGTGDFTVECWVNLSSLTVPCSYISQYTGPSSGWHFRTDTTNGLLFGWGDTSLISTTNWIRATGTWYHIAATRSGTTIKLFVNGSELTSATNSTNLSGGTATTKVGALAPQLGSYANWYTNGYISNARVIKGHALYTSNFIPQTGPYSSYVTRTAASSLLACKSNRLIDNSTNNFTITKNGDVKVTNITPFPNYVYSPTVVGGSMYFDGTGDYLTVADNPAFSFGTGDFTVECWFYIAGNSNNDDVGNKRGALFSTYPTTGTLNGYVLTTQGNTTFTGTGFNFSNAVAGTEYYFSYVGTVNQQVWHHVAVVRSGTTTTLYFNGTNVASAVLGNQNVNTGGNALNIGRLGYNPPTSQYLLNHNGYISNFRIVKGTALYTSNFTPPNAPVSYIPNTSLLLDGNNGGIWDATQRNVIETVGNARVSPVAGWNKTPVLFGGSSASYLQVGETFNFGSKNWTMEWWINFNTAPSSPGVSYRIFEPVNHVFGFKRIAVGFYQSAIGCDYNGTPIAGTAALTWTTGQWYHIALTRIGSTYTFYRDGVNVGSGTNSNALDPDPVGYKIGMMIDGYVSDMRITMAARYTSNFRPPPPNLPRGIL